MDNLADNGLDGDSKHRPCVVEAERMFVIIYDHGLEFGRQFILTDKIP
jgi:hypothetical protein